MLIKGIFEQARFLDFDALLHRLRGRRRDHHQEDGRLPPVLGGQQGGRRTVRGRRRRATIASASSGTRRAAARASRWPSTPARSSGSPRWRTRRSSSSPTATTWTTSSSARSRTVRSCCVRRRCRPRAATTCATSCRSPPAASSSRPSRSSCPEPRRAHPLLSDRRNIVVIADEAHRSQYDFIDGFARHLRDALPNASFIGFTGTPIELTDRNTPRRLRRLHRHLRHPARRARTAPPCPSTTRRASPRSSCDEDEKPHVDAEFEEVTEAEEVERREKLKSKWARLEAMVGTEKRLALVAADLVEHFERAATRRWTARRMVVCMSRRICVDLYDEIVKLRPEWARSRRRRRRAR